VQHFLDFRKERVRKMLESDYENDEMDISDRLRLQCEEKMINLKDFYMQTKDKFVKNIKIMK